MANYKVFEPILLKQEGFYAKKKNDSGGETWEGIARNYYPNWPGWAIIDSYKSNPDFPHVLRSDVKLQALVDTFYETYFWDELEGDNIQNQSVANFLGDWGVNAGLSIPIKHAQLLIGVTSDGKMGPHTLSALNAATNADFFSKLQQARIVFYEAVVQAHPEDKEFMSDWIERTKSFTFQA